MLEFLRARLKELLEKRAGLKVELDEILKAPSAEKRDLNASEATAFESKRGEIRAIDDETAGLNTRITELEDDEQREQAANGLRAQYGQVAPDGPERRQPSGVSVGSEPLTYEPDAPHSYFQDLALMKIRGDSSAADRLTRHAKEIGVELPARERRIRDHADRERRGLDQEILSTRQRRAGLESRFTEKRVAPNRTDGQGGYFVPPLWMIDEFIDLPRFGRPFANRVRGMTLPSGTDSINVPKIATGTLTGMQTDGQQVTSQDMTDTFVNAPVRTIAGMQDVGMQLLDQSPINFDEIIFADLIADLNMQLDIQCINGSGTGNQLLGVMNVSGTNTVSALTTDPAKLTDASTPANGVYPNLASGLSQIAKNRKLPVDSLMVSSSFWYWALSQQDSTGRPVIAPASVAMNPVATASSEPISEGPVGAVIAGAPVVMDSNIPATLGASANEQRPFAVRASDLFLWEGALRTRVLQEVVSDTLQIRFQIWEYCAFMPHRRATSISIYNGASYKVQTGF